MDRYRTLDGAEVDLSALTDHEREHFDRCYAAYESNVAYRDFIPLAHEPGDLAVEAAGGAVRRDDWERPLLRALSDLERRLGIRQGEEHANADEDPETAPLG